MTSFNRTTVALKQVLTPVADITVAPFNRTTVALKLSLTPKKLESGWPF